MNKRYQVFVSSTYTDLKEERQAVFQTLMTMQCIPAGMEWFPAETEEQWNVIKRVIDDCDFYVLILGGRYGSKTREGLSYTEKEFDYAVQKMPVLVFCHENPLAIPVGKSDIDPDSQARLDAFRKKAMTGRMVDMWSNRDQLAGKVSLAVSRAIMTQNAIGWARADQVATNEALTDLNRLNKHIEQLTQRNSELETQLAAKEVAIPDLAEWHESIEIRGKHPRTTGWTFKATWRAIFGEVAPFLLQAPQWELEVRDHLTRSFARRAGEYVGSNAATELEIENHDFQTIKIQLLALKLIETKPYQSSEGGKAIAWTLTAQGEQQMYELRTIRTSKKA